VDRLVWHVHFLLHIGSSCPQKGVWPGGYTGPGVHRCVLCLAESHQEGPSLEML
jgi:hypothetical protein